MNTFHSFLSLPVYFFKIWNISIKTNQQITTFPVSTRRRFDVVTTLFGRRQHCYNVKTTSCVYWVLSVRFGLPKGAKTRPENVQTVGPSLSTITPYHLIFIKIVIIFLERA